MFRSGATATAYDVHQSFFHVLLYLNGHLFGCFVIFPKSIRQSRIGVGGYGKFRFCRNYLQVRHQLFGSQSAIESDG